MRAVFFISQKSQQGNKTGIKEIAEGIDSPEHFLAKILQKLSREGIIQSSKGPNGGFFLDSTNFSRPLADIVAAIEGDQIFVGCGMGLSYCSEENPCPLHQEFKKVRDQLIRMLHTTTIGQFNEELIQGQMTLNK